MNKYRVYSKDGDVRCTLTKVEYSGTFMGDRVVTSSFTSATEIAFEVFDYIEFRGEKFELEMIPTVKKVSSYQYEYDLRFVSLKYELERCMFRDFVPNDNEVVYPTPVTVEFTGKVNYLTERIQACLDRMYGAGVWSIVVSEGVDSEEKNLSLSNQNCWNALSLVNTEYKLNFHITGRTVVVGDSEAVQGVVFEYGKGNGLYEIERAADSDTGIVTKLIAYGGTRNLDYSYPKKPEWSDSVLPNTFILSPLRLMLPSFKLDGKTDYLLADDALIAKYGIREGVMMYDDIYPTITGATNSKGERIDKIAGVDAITDEETSEFDVYLNDLGFDLNDSLTTETPQLVMKTGALQGYAFNIKTIGALSNGGVRVTLEKNSIDNSDTGGYYIPNKDFNMSAGDEFVLLGILMPQLYIRNAEQRLEERAREYLNQYSTTNYSYSIGVDEIFMAKNPSVMAEVFEGKKMKINDAEIGINEELVTIQSLTIEDGDGLIPRIKVTLNNNPSASTLERIQGQIANIESTANSQYSAQTELAKQYQRKLNTSYFNRLFVAIDANGNEIAPNDTTTPIASVRVNYGLWTEQFLSAKGMNSGGGSDEPTGGATTLGGLRNVAADADSTYDVAKMLVLEAKSNLWSLKNLSELVGGLDEAELAEYLTNNNYAKKGDIPTVPTKVSAFENDANYATTSDLDDRINALVNGAPQAYDTLKEIADVLAGNVNSISDILTALGNKADKATTLSGYGITDAYTITQIDSIVNGLSGNISTLQGYFTDGVANSALRLSDNGSYTAWGQTFFTNGKPKSVSGALTDVTDITSSGTITTNKIVIGNGTIEWDEANKGFKVTGLYSTTYLSAKGANTNGGSTPSGNQYTRLDTWDGYTSAMDGWVLSAKLGKGLYDTQNSLISRVGALEGKATNVSFTQSLTSGTQIGTITIDGASKNIYAPTIPTKLSQFTDDVVSGKYLHLSGGTIQNSVGVPLVINNSTVGGASCINFRVANVDKAQIGYENALQGTILYNYNSGKFIGVKDDGTPVYSGNTLWHSGNFTPSDYLPLSGGTISGTTMRPLTIKTSSSSIETQFVADNNVRIYFGWNNQDGVFLQEGVSSKYIGIKTDGTPYYYNGARNTLIHSGNIGSQSVNYATSAGNADTLGGINKTRFALIGDYPIISTNNWNIQSGLYSTNANSVGLPLTSNGNHVIHCNWDSNAANQLFLAYDRDYFAFRRKTGNVWYDWKEVAFTDSNVASATKLQTSRSIWGQSFNGESDVSGNIHLNNSKICWHNDSENYFIDNYVDYVNPPYMRFMGYDGHTFMTSSGDVMRIMRNGNVGIGTTNPQYNLDVVGDVRFSSETGKNSYIYLNRNGSDGGLLFQDKGANKWQIVNTNNGLDFYDYTRGVYALTIGIDGVLNYVGTIHSTIGIYSDGYVSAKGQNTSSDMRLKNVLNEVVLGVKDIANAPSMRFAWKNGGGVDVGSSAQYWQKLLPDAVKERDGMLEMQYANIALLSAIALAKNFETHEERIARLEKENKELRTKIDMMERGIA